MTILHWHYPTEIMVGEGISQQLPDYCLSNGIQRPLIVTDPYLAQTATLTSLLQHCQRDELSAAIFSDISGNPTGRQVELGIDACIKRHHDGIIAVGGGSSMDAAKAIALVARQAQDLWAFEDIGDNWRQANPEDILPVIALPTTAGTGSEVGRAAVITNEETKVKKIIFHPQMLPQQVFLDPMLTLNLPPDLTAATGMDALSHNLEAFCSPNYHPMAESIALEGIRLCQLYLPISHADGSNLQARTQMLIASTMGATAFQKGLGAMHALAHSLGARYNKHHGLLNAILMPYVLCANQRYLNEKMTRLGRYLNLKQPDFMGVLNWILHLRETLNIPNTLADIGLDNSEIELIGMMSQQDAAAASNPIHLTAEQYETIYQHALDGTLDL
ncbi:alcohol dehydrogenase [Photobacterium sanctipauli]|uniref:Alcohol dehydrogenase n=1 Tax=Photobacterium sanctipauli TaxID=1342794 RepID=A0A2T3NWJ3_9GAMM|nr:iron-containing alcohol dehydrogenase [Photobacterium sanctipauli]PSW20621.1 alcohol dehydrogenase [Photobacterium sanctipauli]